MAYKRKSMKKRVAIFIDGSNFYYKIRSLGLGFKYLTEFHYNDFAQWLARDRVVTLKRYYVGVIRAEEDEKSKELQRVQQELFDYLESPAQSYIVKRGFILKKGDVYQEKGVDVQLAIDLIVGAYEDLYDIAIIVSSDTDLIPAIKQLKVLGKEVEYIGTAKEPSTALRHEVSLTRLVRKSDLEQFISERAPVEVVEASKREKPVSQKKTFVRRSQRKQQQRSTGKSDKTTVRSLASTTKPQVRRTVKSPVHPAPKDALIEKTVKTRQAKPRQTNRRRYKQKKG